MTVVFIILFMLILLTIAFLLTPLQFGLETERIGTTAKYILYFKIFGIPVKIPLKSAAASQNKTEKKKQKKESPLTFENFKENISDFKEIYHTSKDELKKMLLYVKCHLSIEKVDFNIHFGFDNAAATGISTGAIWGMGSFILKVIDSLIGIKKINMQVNPDFNNKVFEINSKTVLIMRPIHFIIILKRVIGTYAYIKNKINYIKGGANNGRTSN